MAVTLLRWKTRPYTYVDSTTAQFVTPSDGIGGSSSPIPTTSGKRHDISSRETNPWG